MQLPAYWLIYPGAAPDESAQNAFDALLDAALFTGGRPVCRA